MTPLRADVMLLADDGTVFRARRALAAWGRGIASAALQGFTTYAFDAFALERIFAQVFAWNPASMRVLEKAGYRREGVLRSYLQTSRRGRRDVVLFSLLPTDPR